MLIIASVIILGVLGFVFAGLLALAAEYFKIEEDARVAAILAILPGGNCGACGAAGCHDFATKASKGEISISNCTVGGAEVAKKIAVILGVEGHEIHKKVAVIHCGAKQNQRKIKANYLGVKTCSAANIIESGGLLCSYGCLGYGDCFLVCKFDAIEMKAGLPIIDPEKCTACGKCVSACPKQIITLIPYTAKVYISCSSRERGAETRKICPVGCIACKICEREILEVFKVVDNLAEIDYNKIGINCSMVVEKCPPKCIVII